MEDGRTLYKRILMRRFRLLFGVFSAIVGWLRRKDGKERPASVKQGEKNALISPGR